MAGTLGELADKGLKLRIWCQGPTCPRSRNEQRIDPNELIPHLGRDRPVYGIWTSLRCSACGQSGKVKGAIFAMAEQADVPMGLR